MPKAIKPHNIPKFFRTMKKLFLVVFLISFCSCIKPGCCKLYSADFDFYVVDEQGDDLLDPESTSPIDLQSVRVYYLLDGKKTEINRGNLDAPQMYLVLPPEGGRDKYSINLFLNAEDSSSITTTYFEWNEDTTDVFEAEVSRNKNNTVVTKVWLNETLVWDISTADGKPLYELVK